MSNLKNMFSVGVSIFKVNGLNNNSLITHCKERYSNHKTKNFDNEILYQLKEVFLNEGVNHVKQLLGTDKQIKLKIDNIWGNVNLDESISVPHIHRTSLISSVYYLTKGKLVFLNPYTAALSHIYRNDIEKYNEHNSDIWTCEMEAGDMIIFNSHMYHYAYNDRSNDDRISIACDMSMINE